MPKPINVSTATWAAARKMYIDNCSVTIKQVGEHFGIPEKVLAKWATRSRWTQARLDAMVGKAVDEAVTAATTPPPERQISVVTPEAISDLPVAIQDLHEQCDLLEARNSKLGSIPFEKWDMMLAMKIGQVAVRMLDRIKSLPEEALLDPETVKALKVLAETKEKLRPPDTENTSKRTGSILNVHLMNGVAPEPTLEKRADAVEIGN